MQHQILQLRLCKMELTTNQSVLPKQWGDKKAVINHKRAAKCGPFIYP